MRKYTKLLSCMLLPVVLVGTLECDITENETNTSEQ